MPDTTARFRLRSHVIVAFAALMAIGLIIFTERQSLRASVTPVEVAPMVSAELAIEHSQPTAVDLEVSSLQGHATIYIHQSGPDSIYLNVPARWQRTEVRHVPIREVTAEPPLLNFVRWHLPAGGAIHFRTLEAPDQLTVHHPSDSSLYLTYTLVDLDTEEVQRDSVFMANESIVLE